MSILAADKVRIEHTAHYTNENEVALPQKFQVDVPKTVFDGRATYEVPNEDKDDVILDFSSSSRLQYRKTDTPSPQNGIEKNSEHDLIVQKKDNTIP